MVPRKQTPNGVFATPVKVVRASAVEVSQPPPTSKIPSFLRFPLLLILNLGLSALLYSLASEFTTGDLASVSRSIDGPWEVTGLVGWKALELALGWWGGYDGKIPLWPKYSYAKCLCVGLDLAALTYLVHQPTLFLLTAFYGIRPTTVAASLGIDVLTTYIPFRLLRAVSPTHFADAPKGAVSNRSIINDLPVQGFTSLLGSCIYAAAIYSSFQTWLPVHLVTTFDGLKDISLAHNAQLSSLILFLIPTGIATKIFLFTPSTGAKANLGETKQAAFNPETATLGETIMYNVWGHSKRTRTLIKRTATLAALTYASTVFQIAVTIEGAEVIGAVGWGIIWSAAAVFTGAAFWWVAN
jgi:hypothetical protein